MDGRGLWRSKTIWGCESQKILRKKGKASTNDNNNTNQHNEKRCTTRKHMTLTLHNIGKRVNTRDQQKTTTTTNERMNRKTKNSKRKAVTKERR